MATKLEGGGGFFCGFPDKGFTKVENFICRQNKVTRDFSIDNFEIYYITCLSRLIARLSLQHNS